MPASSLRRVVLLAGTFIFVLCLAGLSYVVATSGEDKNTAAVLKLVVISSLGITVFALAFLVACWSFAQLFFCQITLTIFRVSGRRTAEDSRTAQKHLAVSSVRFVVAVAVGIVALELMRLAT
jgi:lysylphosphatidylglycerol synthetase-like protein (DUF2156 family)